MGAVAPKQRANWHDAYDAQMALWRWYRTDVGREYMAEHLNSAIAYHPPDLLDMETAMYAAEMGRLLDTDPIYASAEMCELVAAAASPDLDQPFAPEPLKETDLITTRGFLFYENAFDVVDRYDRPSTIKAVSWTRMLAHDDNEQVERMQHELVTGMADSDVRGYEEEVLANGAYASGIALTVYQVTPPNWHPAYPSPGPALPMHLTPWFFDMTFDGNEVDINGIPSGAAWWWRIVQTTFRLMQQRIAVKHIHRPDRDSRRQAKKLGLPDDQTVVVVSLRREESPASEEPHGDANYSHRFIVGGHWRNQWYPSEQIHRQIWISPYVKGPKDRPLIVKPRRVYQWNR